MVIGVFLLVLLAVAAIAAAMLFSVKYHKRSPQADDVTGEILGTYDKTHVSLFVIGLGICSSFRFGVVSTSALRFPPPFTPVR